MKDLKPCPFCGRDAKTKITIKTQVIREKTMEYLRFSVYCLACHIEMLSSIEASETFEDAEKAMQRAVNYWNDRPESVKHGKWEQIVIDGFVPDYDCVCSECGKSGVPCNKYCSNCGAKMEGDEIFE